MKISEYLKRTPWTIIGIFSIVAAGILAIGYSYFDSQKNRIKREQYDNLSAIADLKTSQIVQWRTERIGDGEIIRTNPLIADEMKAFLKNPTDTRTRHNLLEWVKLMQTSYGYGNIFFCDPQGKIRLSSITAGDTAGTISRHAIAEALRLKNVVLSDLYRKDSSSPVYMDLVVPLMMEEQRANVVIGVCILRINPEKVLFPLIQLWPTPSRSSETLLIRDEENSVLYLNELRHQKNTALILRFPVTQEKLIAAMALRGIEGTTEGVDYRGIPVLATVRKIPNSPWFMVAKVDQEEVFASLHEEAWREGIVTFILIFAAAASLGLWWRHQRAKFYHDKYKAEIERQVLVTHFDYLTKYANDIIFLTDAHFRIIEANDKALQIYGYTREEINTLCVVDLRSAEAAQNLDKHIRLIDEHHGATYETIHQRKDGSTFPIEVSVRPFEIDGKKFYQTIGRDITERKLSAEALMSSESFLNSIVDQSPIPMWISDDKGSLIRINQACLDMLNISAEEVVGKYNVLEDSIVEEEGFLPLVKRVFDEGETARFELKYDSEKLKHLQLKNFAQVILDVTIFPIRDPAGKITNAVIQHVDITARKKAEETIRESEQRFSSIYDTVGDILFLVDVEKNGEYRFASVNQAFLSTTGLPSEAIAGKRVNDIIPETSLTLVLNKYSQAIREKTIVRWEETSDYPTGRLTGEVSVAPIFDKKGVCTHLVGAIHDITERKKNELKIIKLNRTYAVLSNINQLIVRERDLHKMLDGVCKIAVNDGGFSMTWVGLLKEESNIITPMASAGMTGDYLDHLNLSTSDTPEGRGQLGEDLRNGQSVIINDIEHNKRSMPWRERALGRGYKSSAVFPLRKGNKIIGTFSFYSNELQFFTIDEVHLLEELAMDVSYALESMELEEQRKHAEEALQISEKNFRSFIESAPDAIFVQTQLRFAYLNPAALKLFGAESAEQMLGQPVMDRFHPDVREIVREMLKKLNHDKESVPKLEQKYLRLDGTTVGVEVSAVSIFYEGHNGALVFVSDISERKKIETFTEKLGGLKQQLISAKGFDQKLKIITDALVHVFGADFARVWIIKEADLCEKGCIHAGVSTGPDVCRNRTSCLHLISSSGRYTHIDGGHRRVPFGAYKIGRVASGEDNKFITNDVTNDSRVHDREWAKSLGLVSFAGFRLISTEGKPIGVMALFRNRAIEYYEEKYLEDIANTISQVILAGAAEEALEESETRAHFLADVIQNASQPFAVGLPDGRLNQYNAAFLKLTGYTQEEIVSINWYQDLTPVEWRDIERSQLEELQRTDKPVRYEKEYIRKDGSRVPVELLVHLHRNEHGQPEYYYAFITDITEQKRLQYQLLQSQKIQSIGTLAGGIAHDFNNILGIIMGYASLLERGGVTSEKFFSHLNAIKLSVERGASLVRQILTFARRTDVAFEPINVPDLVNDLLSMIKETFPKMITIQNVIEEDIPTINADRTQLHQALLNLFVNARDAMPIGGELMITVEKVKRNMLTKRFPSADQDYYVCIRVSDTGVGMSEEIRSRVFDPFFTTKEKGKGTGLGLSVVLGIVQSHRGFADVESSPGAGTTFTLYIPLPSYQKKNPDIRVSEDGTVKGGSETILIVEDEILLLEITQSMLESNGYNVLTAGDGEQAVELYTRHQEEIALVITDMGMPKLSGVEEIKKLREINPHVKIILATGFLESGTKAELLKSGAKEIIQKPYLAKEILRLIREVLETPDE